MDNGQSVDNQIITALDVPGSIGTDANGVNDAGYIVGSYLTPDMRAHGFLYDPTKMQFSTIDAPDLAGQPKYTILTGINDARDIVGTLGSGGPSFIATPDHSPPVGAPFGNANTVLLPAIVPVPSANS